jgi:hypothetical protein
LRSSGGLTREVGAAVDCISPDDSVVPFQGGEPMAAQQNKADVAHLKSKPWASKDFFVPQEVLATTTMLTYEERRMLYYLALNYYTGQGAIVDMGAYLGGSTICFAAALQQSSFAKPPIHSYDLFRLSKFELELHFRDNPPKDLKTRETFDENLRDYRHLLNVHEGDVLDFPWEEEERIELLFVDIAKSYNVFDHIVLSYFPSLIPLRSLVIMQDYLWTSGPWHHVVMEKLSDYFEYIFDTNVNSEVFLLTQDIPQETLRQCAWTAIPYGEKVELMNRAIDKLDTESKKEHLRGSREILLQGKDMTRGMQYHKL